MVYIIIGIIVVLLIAIYTVVTYNQLQKLKIRVEEGFSTMDVYLKKRWDLIPQLVEVVKGYMKHEKELLQELTNIRTSSYSNLSFQDKANTTDQLSEELAKIIAVSENYPELKASEQYLNLQKSLSKMESQLQAARRIYNNEVTKYNTKIATVPSNIIAGLFGFKEADLFTIEEYKKENIEINLGE
jgi:LemA protein